MATDTQVYRAMEASRAINDNTSIADEKDIVYEILKSKGEPLKRETIIDLYKKKRNCENLEIDGVISNALSKLIKQEKIEKVDHGVYQCKK